jgi:hypothetical protein
MKQTAAFRWNSKTKEVSYFVVDPANVSGSRVIIKKISDKSDAYEAVNAFRDLLIEYSSGGTVEYKILNQTAPWNHKANPNELSEYILDQFRTSLQSVETWTLANQIRSLLRKPELTSFSKAMRNLRLADSADEWHLWAVALHATKKNFKTSLMELWQKITKLSVSKKELKKQFGDWYSAL